MEIARERSLEIQQWLTERLTVQQVEGQLREMDQDWEKHGVSSQWLYYYDQQFRSVMQPQDEIWLYDSGPESWENLCGEIGIALVRAGHVINVIMFRMN